MKKRVCSVEHSGSLDNKIRRLIQNPKKILSPYISEGMSVIEIGCGPGFFTLDMAEMVGSTGRVIAVDMQEGMLKILEDKVKRSRFEKRVVLHKCGEDKIGVTEQADFVLLFYMVHEVANKGGFFQELLRLVKSTGKILIVEPPFHVSKNAFDESLQIAKEAGFSRLQGPKMFMHKTAILQKAR